MGKNVKGLSINERYSLVNVVLLVMRNVMFASTVDSSSEEEGNTVTVAEDTLSTSSSSKSNFI